MKIEESLTKENFWNEIETKYPNAFKIFADWIDEYKKEVKWNYFFGAGHKNYNDFHGAPKFHDIPHAMQLGIWLAFIKDTTEPCYMIPDLHSYNLNEWILGYMDNKEEDLTDL